MDAFTPAPEPAPGQELPPQAAAPRVRVIRAERRRPKTAWLPVLLLAVYLAGLGSGYGLWGLRLPEGQQAQGPHAGMAEMVEQINPPDGYVIPASAGSLGPQMVAAGVIDRDRFLQTYEQAGRPLNREQLDMLDGAHTGSIRMDQTNAYFLLNFFWALGLSSKNQILDAGPIQQYGSGEVEGFASTGGWTLAARPVSEVFSSLELFKLSEAQQELVEEAAAGIFRPCCDNPTHFPDCNHGMAMLGMLQLMAAQGAGLEEMLAAAKYVNAFWYPRQTLEQAVYFQNVEGKAFSDVDPRLILSAQYSSGSGFARLHQFISDRGWLPQGADSGGGCSV